MKNEVNSSLKVMGILMTLFGVIYAVVGTLALTGTLTNVLPAHETQEILVIVISYAVALFAIIGGIAAVKGDLKISKVIGAVFAVVGLGSLIYMQLAYGTFNLFDCMAMVLGVSVVFLANKLEKN